MKYHITLKFLAILLAAVCLTTAVISGFGVILLYEEGLYWGNAATVYEELYAQRAERLGNFVLSRYITNTLSDVPETIYYYDYSDTELSQWYDVLEEGWHYAIFDEDGELAEQRQGVSVQTYRKFTVKNTGTYYVQTTDEADYDGYTQYDGKIIYYKQAESPVFTVEISMAEGAVTVSGLPMLHLETLIGWRYGVIWVLVFSLLLFAVCLVYLCCAAGKTHRTAQPNPGGLNRLPLDIYTGGIFLIGFFVCFIIVEGLELFNRSVLNWGILAVSALLVLAACLALTGWLFALAAQLKMKQLYWWHNSLVGRCADFLLRGVRFLLQGGRKLFDLLPMVWKRVTVIGCIGFGLLLSVAFLASRARFFGALLLMGTIFGAILLLGYDIYAFGQVMKGARRMAEGNLEEKIPVKYLWGSYKDHADHLNAMADVATVAAKQQMKSERMKAELITNVSHDIKTPLTSVINYVDLLQKPHSPQEEQQYLEVLERQAQRMKKLLEDLMEMSKASTGNITVETEKLDAVETVNQALGEFADKLTFAKITPLFRHPESPVYIQADGKLTWRVLSNLLGNVVKYAQPDTRLYVDLLQMDGRVWLSLKNISREELNISADELTERFVRGDASRNTEGNGLGLNIAQSLMELQKGKLELFVDGDLFKVILSFPINN